MAEVGGIAVNAAETTGSHRGSRSKGRAFVELARGDGLSYVLIPMEHAAKVAVALAAYAQNAPALRPTKFGERIGTIELTAWQDRIALRRRWEERIDFSLANALEIAIEIAAVVREFNERGTALLVRVEHMNPETGRQEASLTNLPVLEQRCPHGSFRDGCAECVDGDLASAFRSLLAQAPGGGRVAVLPASSMRQLEEHPDMQPTEKDHGTR